MIPFRPTSIGYGSGNMAERILACPFTNFLGWYLVVYVIYQLFANYLRGRALGAKPLPSGYWHWPVILYALSAVGDILIVLPKPASQVVFDPTGTPWHVSTITGACALASIFVMGGFTIIAWLRLRTDRNGEMLLGSRLPSPV